MADYYINSAAGGGGDGSSGNPYNTWAAFEAARAGNLTTMGQTNVYIRGNLTASPFTMSASWINASAVNYIRIAAWPGYEGNGTYGNAPMFSGDPGPYGTLFSFTIPYTRIAGVDFYMTNYGTDRRAVLLNASNLLFEQSIIRNLCTTGVSLESLGTPATIRNVLVVTAATSTSVTIGDYTTTTVDFVTVSTSNASTSRAFDAQGANGTITCRNCVAWTTGSGAYTVEWSATGWAAASSNNAGQRTSANQPVNIRTNYVQLSSDPFVATGSGNFHPNSGGALSAGLTVTGITTDLMRVTRGGTPYIGAYEPVAAAVPVLTSPTGSADTVTGSTGNTADLSVSTDTGSGTMYWFVSTSATPPSVANLKSGSGATSYGSAAVSGTGAQTFSNVGSFAEKTTYYAYFIHNATAGDSSIAATSSFTFGTDAPTLSAATATQTGSSTANLSVATNRTAGTLWTVITGSATQPSVAQFKAGQDHTGAAAYYSANDTSVSNPQTFSATGLPSGSALYAHYYQEDAEGDGSNRITTSVFNTLSVVSSVTGTPNATTGTSNNTADLSMSVTGPSGTLYWFLSTSATPPSVANLKAGVGANDFGNQAVSGAGAQTVSAQGALTEKLSYYLHALHTYASQDSAIATSSAIVVPTDAPTISAGSPTVSVTSDTTATLSVATTRTAGTMWAVVTNSATQPSTAQIKSGQNHLGAAAAFAVNDVSVSNPQSFSATSLSPATGYYAHFYQEDAEGDGSNRFTSGSFTTTASGTYSVDSFAPGVIRPGTVVTASISGNWAAGSKTATINGHPVTLTSQSTSQVQFTAPSFHTDPTYADTPYNVAVQFVLTDGGFQGSHNYTQQPPSGYDFIKVTSVGGIWADDVGVVVGDDHLGHWTAGTADPISSDGILSHISGYPATYEYWRFDISEVIWTANAIETFYETVLFNGSNYANQLYYEGVAISSLDLSASFNHATANISSYAEVGQAVPGLTLNTSTGAVTGTPTTQGSYSYAVRATDSDGNTAGSNAFSIVVYETPVWVAAIGNQTWIDGQLVLINLNSAINSNGYGPATSWSQSGGSLPTGVTLNTGTGIISGTVAADASLASPYAGQDFNAINTAGSAGMPGTFSITVLPATPTFTGTIQNITISSGGAMTPFDVSGHFPAQSQTYSLVGTPPTGISIHATTGVISGTPTTFGVFSIQVHTVNVSGAVTSNVFTITVSATVPTFTGSISNIGPLPIGVAMTPVDVSSQFGGDTGTFSFASGAPPAGISLSSAGVLSGSPTVAVVDTGLVIRKTNASGTADSNVFSITTVGGVPVLTTPLPNRQDLNASVINIDFKTFFGGASSVAVTGLPAGLSDAAGVVTGTLTTVQSVTTTVTATNAAGSIAPTFTWQVLTLVPTLSSVRTYPKATTALLRATTDRASGTLYWVVTLTSTTPSAAQIKAGQNAAGAAGVASGSQAVSYVGEQSINASGLSALTTYYIHWIQNNTAGDSNRLTSPAWSSTSGVNSGGDPFLDF